MKALPFFFLVFCILNNSAHSENFSPTLVKLAAPKVVQYDFNGKEFTLPVQVSGTPASVFFLLFTKDKAATINEVQNGYLGWHYMNRIDTCMYISPPNQLNPGSNTLAWDGRDENGETVEPGAYTYYLWGFDNVSSRILMTRYMRFDPWGFRTIITHDTGGNPLAQPVIYMSDSNRSTSAEMTNHTNSKWAIGNDPYDATFLETSISRGWCDVGGLAFLPTDYRYYFHDTLRESGLKVTSKWEWVPNGNSILQADWGEDGQFSYSGSWPKGWNFGPGCVSDGGDYLFLVNADISGAGTESQLIVVDIGSGTEFRRIDLSEWWIDLDGQKAGGQICGGPTGLFFRNNILAVNGFTSCVNQVINPYTENREEMTLWLNTNGDYTGDRHFEPNSLKPWVCNDDQTGPYKYNVSLDKNQFTLFPCYDMGAVSFGLYAPDGTGMGYHAFMGENADYKCGIECIDYGSSYDGLYTMNPGVGDNSNKWWYESQDSCKGTIVSPLSVSESTPLELRVFPNLPNPFNPSTTISFTLPRAERVKVDVYNLSGQRVGMVLDRNLEPGKHSVSWNAGKLSAGVYLGLVQAGTEVRTVKMLFLK